MAFWAAMSYSNAIGGGAIASKAILDLQKKSAKEWIACTSRNKPLSPQTFEQIDDVLQKNGKTYKADELLYAGAKKSLGLSGSLCPSACPVH